MPAKPALDESPGGRPGDVCSPPVESRLRSDRHEHCSPAVIESRKEAFTWLGRFVPRTIICVWHNRWVKPLRFTRSARKHRIGKTSARYVIATTTPVIGQDPTGQMTTRSWLGPDERGRELEIVAIECPDCWLVVHVMPATTARAPHDPT